MSANLGESIRLGKRVCEEDSAVTLRASDGKMGDNQPVVAMNYNGYNQAGKEECCHTLGTCNSESPNNDKVVKVAIKCCPLNSMVLGKDLKVGDRQTVGFGDETDPCPTLQAAHHHAAAIKMEGEVMTEQDIAQMKYIVRRLTPIECERLMGLPDGWTIPSNLKITEELVEEFQRVHDTYGAIMYEYAMASYERSHREGEPPPNPPKPKSAAWVRKWFEKITNPDTCPDTPRYKGCGNGWATNQPRWIFLRLLAVEGIDPWWGEFDEAREAKENSDVSDN
jgi:hypothetical protein